MDIAFIVIGLLLIVFSFLVGISCGVDRNSLIKIMGTSTLIGIALLTWAGVAALADYDDKVITIHPIEERKDVSYYFNENNVPIPLRQQWQIVDPNKYQIRVTQVKSHWKYGIYVVGSRTVELMKIEPTEKN